MKQREEACKTLKISKSTLSRLINGKRTATNDQKRILTELLWKDAGAAFEPEYTIRSLHTENWKLKTEISERDATIETLVKGDRVAMFVACCILGVCLLVCAALYAPRWERIKLYKIAGQEILRIQTESLERELADARKIIEAWERYGEAVEGYATVLAAQGDDCERRLAELLLKLRQVK